MIVADSGPPDAKILICGEAPGADEERTGNPFVGQSGKLLRRMLSHSGINFADCYVTNVVDERPAGNNFAYFYEEKNRKVPTTRLSNYWDKLWRKIKAIKPNVVIALGGEALRALTRKRSIMAWRGTVILVDGIKILPTLHPSYILRVYGDHAIAELDFLKALGESHRPEYLKPVVHMTIMPTLSEVFDWIDTARKSNIKRIGHDIETIETHVRCLSLAYHDRATKETTAISIPFIKMASSSMAMPAIGAKTIVLTTQSESASSYWNTQDETIILESIAKLFADKSIEIVGQNSIAFDAPILDHEFGLKISNHYMDTMHAWHELYSEFPKSLSFLCSILTNHQNYWSEKETSDDASEARYNAMDAAVTVEVSYKIEAELKEFNLWNIYREVKHPLVFALTKAQNIGVLIDKERQAQLVVETEREMACIKHTLGELACTEFNPLSPKQVCKLLYEEMKFPTMYNMEKRITANEEALLKLHKKYPGEQVLVDIIKYRKVSKLLSTYLKASADEDGRMRTSYNASGTKGCRISSSKTIWKTGLNLQNIPVREAKGIKNIRDLFIAGEGNIFVKGDLRQAETMVVAHILRRIGDKTLFNKYQDPNFDIHKWGATGIFDITEDAVEKWQRDVAKTGNHSGNYMAGPRVMMVEGAKVGVDIDYNLAKQILKARAKAIPGLRIWWSDVERRIKGTRMLTTCLGRRRMFFGRFDDTTLRDAVSYEPQSTVGDLCSRIFTRLSEELKEGCRPLLQVHDECLVECPKQDARYVIAEMEKASNIVLNVSDVPFIIPIDISVGTNWKDCVKI